MAGVPADYGLPADHFPRFRSRQEETALDIAWDDRRFPMLSAPPGVGKSAIYVVAAQASGARMLAVTVTKGLQDQLMRDFGPMGMKSIKGKANYKCPHHRDCETGTEEGCPLTRVNREKTDPHEWCTYIRAKEAATEAQLVVTNYAYWMTTGRYEPGAIGDFDMVVLDEGHQAPWKLAEFCTVEVERKAAATVGIPVPEKGEIEGFAGWHEWARGVVKAIADKEIVKPIPKAEERLFAQLAFDIKQFANYPCGVKWVIEDNGKEVKFSPVWADPWAESLLFRGAKKVVLSSATLSPMIRRYLGIAEEQSRWVDMPSPFPANRRPFYIVRSGLRIDHTMSVDQFRVIVNMCDDVIANRADRKGLVHSLSYSRAKLIEKLSRHNNGTLLVHSARDTAKAFSQFRRSEAPCVLVTPVAEEGVDLPHDDCRFQIVIKVPFRDFRSPVMAARKKEDRNFPNYLAAMALMQMYGRSTRAGEDWSETLIFDDHFRWFWSKIEWPKSFKDAWRWVDAIPPPLNTAG